MRTGNAGARTVGLGLVALAAAVAVLPSSASATRNLYVTGSASDNVHAYDFGDTGGLTEISGSPFTLRVDPMDVVTPNAVALTPDGRRLYTVNHDSDAISAFTVSDGGSLSPVTGSPFAVGPNGAEPTGIAIAPDGFHLWVTNKAIDRVAAFTIGSTGSLSPVTGSPYESNGTPIGIAVTPDGRFLYTSNTNAHKIAVYSVSPAGSLTPLPTPACLGCDRPAGISVTPDGRFLYAGDRGSGAPLLHGFSIGAGGDLIPVPGSPFSAGFTAADVSVTPDGRFLVSANPAAGSVTIRSIGVDGGLATLGAPSPSGMTPEAVAITPDSRRAYAAARMSSNVFGFDIGAAGALTPIGGSPFAAPTDPDFDSIVVSPNQGPSASFTATPGGAGQPTTFSAAASSDSDGTVARYDWDFGDGVTLADGGPTPSHIYAKGGNFDATVTVTDNEGCSTAVVFTGQTASCNGGPAATASRRVSVDGTPPKLELFGPKSQKLGGFVSVIVRCDEACNGTAGGKLIVTVPGGDSGKRVRSKRSFRFKPVRFSVVERARGRLRLRLPKTGRAAAADALGAGGKVKAKLIVSAADTFANSASARRQVTLKTKR